MMNNQEMLTKLFNTIIRVISRTTSNAYAVVSLTNIVKSQSVEFPFVNYITLDCPTSSANIFLRVDSQINSVRQELIGRLITKIMAHVFVTDIVKNNVLEEFDKVNPGFIDEIKTIGVIIS
jgi:hypothetical protein